MLHQGKEYHIDTVAAIEILRPRLYHYYGKQYLSYGEKNVEKNSHSNYN